MIDKIVCITLALLCLCSCQRQKTFEQKTAEEIEEFNQREVPKRMDKVTVMDSIAFDSAERTLAYCYTLEGIADNDSTLNADLQEAQRVALLDNVKGSIQLRSYKEQGFCFEYRYYSRKTGRVLMSFLFTPADYGL